MAHKLSKFTIDESEDLPAADAIGVGEIHHGNVIDVVVNYESGAPMYAVGRVERDDADRRSTVWVDPGSLRVPEEGEDEFWVVRQVLEARAYARLFENVGGKWGRGGPATV